VQDRLDAGEWMPLALAGPLAARTGYQLSMHVVRRSRAFATCFFRYGGTGDTKGLHAIS
jgi:hypothetical protein